jgi:hypothetical protein
MERRMMVIKKAAFFLGAMGNGAPSREVSDPSSACSGIVAPVVLVWDS